MYFLVGYKEIITDQLSNLIEVDIKALGYLYVTSDDVPSFGWASSSPTSAHPIGNGLIFGR